MLAEEKANSTSTSVGLEDLTLLTNLTERDINDNLKLRFDRNLIYTNIGNVLLSVNPYKRIPFLYDGALIEFYKLGGKERSLSNVLALQRRIKEKILLLLETNSAKQSALHQRFGNRNEDSSNNSGGGNAGSPQTDAAVMQALQQHHKTLIAGLTGGSGGNSRVLAQLFPCLTGGPHVFQLANNMYHSLLTEEENQTVIISGESGAGKTEASKQIINFISYLTDRQRAAAASSSVAEMGEEDTIEKIKSIILESNPLMEAFGNAKTVKNDNSSRFGKFFEIYFPKSDEGGGDGHERKNQSHHLHGLPVGGHMSVFLLEKSRVVQQQYGERNFHIFYQLIAGLDSETKSRLRLDTFDKQRAKARGVGEPRQSFRYLNSGRTATIDRVDDRAEFATTRGAMRVVGISETVQTFIFEVLAVILHLGELEFVDANGQTGGGEEEEESGFAENGSRFPAAVVGGSVCTIRNQDTLQLVASLLKLDDAAALQKALTVKVLEVGEKSEVGQAPGGGRRAVQVVEVPLDLAECRNNRDAVAKLLYDAIFNFIVYFINNALKRASALTEEGQHQRRKTKGDKGRVGADSSSADEGDAADAAEEEDLLFQHFARNMQLDSIAEAQEANAEKYLMLGVLDIYGFEIFANNSFEQLCINYINEKLHQIFIDLTLKKEQEEYESENITLPQRIDSYFDNKRILNVIEGTSGGGGSGGAGDGNGDGGGGKAIPGVFQLLDDVCVSLAKEPERIADAKFLEKLNMFLSTSPAAAPFFQKSEKNGFFTVKHYAGNVTYNVNGFVTKNKDKLSNTVLAQLRRSGHIFVSEILAPTMALLDEEEEQSLRSRQLGVGGGAGAGGGARKKNVFLSAGRKIRQQADTLVAKLRSSNIHYIRTIKPNEEKRSDLFVDECVLHQIQYLGLMENVKIRKMGFIYRNYFDVFLRRFYIIFSLMNERVKRREYSPYGRGRNGGGAGYAEPFNVLEHDDKESCGVLLSFVEHEVGRLQSPQQSLGSQGDRGNARSSAALHAGFEPGWWQLGTTKVFIRQPTHLATLERLREGCVDAKVRKIQRCYRSYRDEKANILLKQRMSRLFKRRGKARRADSVFRAYTGDYLDIKNPSPAVAGVYLQYNSVRNHRDLLRLLRFDPLAVGWRELFSQRDGKFYYVNLFTGESRWTKPAAMVESEQYSDDNAAEAMGGGDPGDASGGSGGDGGGVVAVSSLAPVNVEGVRVVFSAKVDRLSIALPLPFGHVEHDRHRLDAESAAAVTAVPHVRTEEHIAVMTNKALFLFREVVEEPTADTTTRRGDGDDGGVPHGRSRGERTKAEEQQQQQQAAQQMGSEAATTTTTTTSRLALVKRIDLRLLRGISVSPYADDFLFLHVYPQLEPYRPIFASAQAGTEASAEAPAGKGEHGKGRRKAPQGKRNEKRVETGEPPQPAVTCDCCGRQLLPSTPRAHCPCCGRLCCLKTCLTDSSATHHRRHQRRPLPTLLGGNVVNPEGLAAVVQEKMAALAAVAAVRARNAKTKRAALKGKGEKMKRGKGTRGTTPAPAPPSALGEGDGEDDDDHDDGDRVVNHVLTAEDIARMEGIVVCVWCVNLEPRELNEDVVLKTFLRTELAAFALQEYKRLMGFDLPFAIADEGISLSLSLNKEAERRFMAASATAAAAGQGELGLLRALVAVDDAAKGGDKKGKGKRKAAGKKGSAAPPPAPHVPDVPLPFSTYHTVMVHCTSASAASSAGTGGDDASTIQLSWSDSPTQPPPLQQQQQQLSASSSVFGQLTLTTTAPAGLAKSVIASIEAARDERRRLFEKRRREEEAALRAKAEAKAQEREEAYARLVEEKKRARRERAAQERNARLWKEEEQRQKREAAAKTVAEKAKRGP